MGVNYQVGFWALIKNAFLLFLGTLPQTIFFAALAAIPFLLFLIPNSFFLVVGIFILLLFGIAYALLVWLDFAQWVFDKYINPKSRVQRRVEVFTIKTVRQRSRGTTARLLSSINALSWRTDAPSSWHARLSRLTTTCRCTSFRNRLAVRT